MLGEMVHDAKQFKVCQVHQPDADIPIYVVSKLISTFLSVGNHSFTDYSVRLHIGL